MTRTPFPPSFSPCFRAAFDRTRYARLLRVDGIIWFRVWCRPPPAARRAHKNMSHVVGHLGQCDAGQVKLASALIDVAPPTIAQAMLTALPEDVSADTAAFVRLPAAARMPLLGRQMLLDCFRLHSMVQ